MPEANPTFLSLPQEEAVPENLKNVLLIMSSNGYLVPPSKDPAREELWNETWKRIDRFLPSLRADLVLEEEVPAQAATVEEPPKSAGLPSPAVAEGEPAQVGEVEGEEKVEEA
jgi:brefeldin A-resistance guanine nucleotide exchange factor 1